jgi:hypothetical protein
MRDPHVLLRGCALNVESDWMNDVGGLIAMFFLNNCFRSTAQGGWQTVHSRESVIFVYLLDVKESLIGVFLYEVTVLNS